MNHWLHIFQGVTFRWQDAVDILLVAVIIYRILVIVRQTIAKQLLYGIGLLYVLSVLTDYFRLFTLQFLIGHVWGIAALVIVIIIQPELRQALAQFGAWRLFRSSKLKEEFLVDEVCKAVGVMAARRTGGLIAVERTIGLRTYIEKGVEIDAAVKAELLRNIFFPDSPLHDGGVVIHNGRITAAACLFPLTMRPFEDKGIGTRHRAAIGLSEETDAVVVVVSEETGQVAIAMEGKLLKPLPIPVIRTFLVNALRYKGNREVVDQAFTKIATERMKTDSLEREVMKTAKLAEREPTPPPRAQES